MAKGLFGGGDGSEENPFLVEDAADLMAIQNKNFENYEYYYRQTANIDMQGIDFQVIGDTAKGPPFGGIYDGDRYLISNLTMNGVNANHYVALFGYVIGTVKNVFVKNASINGIGQGIAVIAGYVYRNIENCTVEDCVVNGESNYVGGLFAHGGGTIKKCEVINCDITGNDRVGVFCAYQSGSKFENCIADGVATLTDTTKSNGTFRIGPFGDTYTNRNTFINCYANVSLKGANTRVSASGGYVYSIGFQYAFADINSNTTTDCYSNVDNITDSNWVENVNYFADTIIQGSDGSYYTCNTYQVDQQYDEETGTYGPHYDAAPTTGSKWTDYWEGLIGSTKNPQARSLPQMLQKSTYENWDFKDTWKWIDGKLPRLNFKAVPVLITCKRVPLTNYRR